LFGTSEGTMARRRSSGSDINLDSLLDTLFNVVGILVIIQVVVMVGAQQAVERVVAGLEEYMSMSSTEYDKLAEAAKDLREELEKLGVETKALPEEIEKEQVEFKKIEEVTRNLKAELAKKSQMNVDLAKVLEELDKKKKEFEKTENEYKAQLARLQELKGMLGDTPLPKAPEAVKVQMPNPRSAPDKAEAVVFFVRDGRIIEFREEQIVQIVTGRILPVIQRAVKETPTHYGGMDCELLAKRFEVGTGIHQGGFHVTLWRPNEKYIYPYLQFNREEDVGEGVEELAANGSKYRQALARIKQGHDYARYYVWPDSFNVYLKAREVADGYDLPAGWEIRTDEVYRKRLIDYPDLVAKYTHIGLRCNLEKPPPPPPAPEGTKPAPPPPAPTGPVIPPPKGKKIGPTQID